jgi:hypothetical protein
VTLALPDSGLPDHDSNKNIPDLCSRLAYFDASATESPGFLDATDTRYYVYPEQDMGPKASGCVATLAQILSQGKPARLSRKQRYNVALDLASSFVQLMSTPWITTSLNKEAIEFFQTTGGTQLGPPLVARRFEPEEEDAAAQSTGINTAAINALGVLLLELCFGKPIEEHAFRESLGNGGYNPNVAAAFDLMAALQWQTEVVGEAGSDYSDAVEWCLRGCHMSSSDASWRKEMMQKVITPLERCSSYF